MHPVPKKLFCIVFCLSLLASLFAGCTEDEPYPTIIPGSWSIETEIIYRYYTQETPLDFQMRYHQDQLSLRFRGVFNDTYVVFVDGPLDYTNDITYEYVNGTLFLYSTSQRLLAYHQGKFYLLADAFHAGYLTAEDVATLYQSFLQTDANDKGQVPTVREECTHNQPEPTVESTPPVTASEPTAPTETTETTEPVNATELLPDIPAVTDPCEKPENMTLENLVYTLYDHSVTYTDYRDQEQTIHFHLPAILPFCEGAIAINQDIRSNYAHRISSARNRLQDHYAPAANIYTYNAYLHENILTILVSEQLLPHDPTYTAYHLDIVSGLLLDSEDVLSACLTESYPAFLQRSAYNLVSYFEENPLSDNYGNFVSEIPTNANLMREFMLFPASDGTIMFALTVPGSRLSILLPWEEFDRYGWENTDTDSYSWLFHLPINEVDGAYPVGRLLLTSFFQAPREFITMLANEDEATIQNVASYLDEGLYSLEEINRFRELTDNIYVTTPHDSKVSELASFLHRNITMP